MAGEESSDSTGALEKQVGGRHYVSMEIQPVRFILKNSLGYCEGNIIKYICRWNRPGGNPEEDLAKAKHYIDLLLQFNGGDDDGSE